MRVLDRVAVLAGLTLVVLTACQAPGPPARRPTATDVAAILSKNAHIDEITYAELSEDGRDEVLVAATLRTGGRKELTAFVLALEGGRFRRVLQYRLRGEGWLPIQVGRPAPAAPVAAVFASQAGSGGYLDYVALQDYAGAIQITLARGGIFSGGVRFVPEGLLESEGDTDRLYRWVDSNWQVEELSQQYLPQLPPDSIIMPYIVDETRGPVTLVPQPVRAHIGQHVYLRRMDRGMPSRIMRPAGKSPDSHSIGADGLISLLQADEIEIAIEGPAYSDRWLFIRIRVEP